MRRDEIQELIREGATPRALEEAVVDWETKSLSKQIGIDAQILRALCRRWGITREAARRAFDASS